MKYSEIENLIISVFVLILIISTISCGSEETVQNSSPVILSQTFEVDENSPFGTVIGHVVASDPDPDQTLKFFIVGGNENSLFSLDQTTGRLVTLANKAPDFEVTMNTLFELDIEVIDNGSTPLSARAQITVSLSDVQIPLNGLIASYSFNGNADDSSGNDNHGLITNAQLIEDRYGKSSSAYSFSENAYIDCGISTLFDLGNYQEYSISVWIKPNQQIPLSGLTILSRYNPVGDRRFYRLSLDPSLGTILYKAYNNGQTTQRDCLAFAYDLTWQHLVIVKNQVSTSIYINSQLAEQTPSTIEMKQNEMNVNFVIGALNFSDVAWDQKFDGLIDDIRIYNKAITDEEIELLNRE